MIHRIPRPLRSQLTCALLGIPPAGRGGRAERQAMRRLRRRATIALKGILQILETAHDHGLRGEEWATLEVDAQAIVQALKRVERPDEMEIGVASLEQRQREAR